MTRIAFRLAFPADQPAPEIVCAGCGSAELQAGIAVARDAIKTAIGENGQPISVVDTHDAQALCDACLRLLLAGQGG